MLLIFAGNLTGDTFTVGEDAAGNTRLTDPPAMKIAGSAIATPASTAHSTPSLTNPFGVSNVALLGNYIASAFASAGVGQGGTLTAEVRQNQPSLLTHPHA